MRIERVMFEGVAYRVTLSAAGDIVRVETEDGKEVSGSHRVYRYLRNPTFVPLAHSTGMMA